MSSPLGENVWIFHAGALGDHVMIWPLVRALARRGASVTVVAATSHARQCEREIGRQVGAGVGNVRGMNTERPRVTRMWTGRDSVAASDIESGVDAVVSFVADDASEAGRRWVAAASAMFPGASVLGVGWPGSASRGELWHRAGVQEFGVIENVKNPRGPIVLFVGAGGEAKRWPMERWCELAVCLDDGALGAQRAQLIAGPVEAERLSEADRTMFVHAGGFVIGKDGGLAELAELVRGARLFIGGDTGPTHLAAQLGVPTLALFGPTDPTIWSPDGPSVRVLAPARPESMEWLSVEDVNVAANAMLAC